MPRRGGGFGGSRSRSSSPRQRGSPPPRQNTTAQQPQQNKFAPQSQQRQQGGSMMGGIGGMVLTGMAFGAGSAIAHEAVRGVMGSGHGQQHQQGNDQQEQQQQNNQQTQNPCFDYQVDFANCLNSVSDLGRCQTYMDILKECQKKNL